MDKPVTEQNWGTGSQRRSFLPYLIGLGLIVLISGGVFTLWAFLTIEFDDTTPRIFQAYLQDLNGDDHLDVYLTYHNEVNRILLNDGAGDFKLYDPWPPSRDKFWSSASLALGDLDGDGQLEAIINNHDGEEIPLMCADAPSGYSLPTVVSASAGMSLGMWDSDDDGVANAFLPNCCKSGTVFYNYKTYTNPVPCLGEGNPNAVALVDLNGDGSLDAFLADGHRRRAPNSVWFNDGHGGFTDSGQRLGNAISMDVAIADINADGYPDAVVANQHADEVWLNDGQGNFTDSGQRLERQRTLSALLADLDADGDLDYFAPGDTSGQVWLNEGGGVFQVGDRIRYGREVAVALGDVNGDDLPDLFIAGVDKHQVWRGDGSGSFIPSPELTGTHTRTVR